MNSQRIRTRLIAAIVIALASLVSHGAETKPVRSVLFVGNSYCFDVPKVFAQFCKQAGRNVKVEQITKGGWTFASHVASNSASRFTEGWDVIVIQGQSQEPAFPEEQVRRDSLPAAVKLVAAAKAAGAHAMLYETWGAHDGDKRNAATFPDDTYDKMQDRLIAGYAMIAKESGAEIAPVGHAWRIVRTKHPEIDLYAKDGRHPGEAGVHLAASVFYAAIFHDDPTKLPALAIPADTAKALHEAASIATPAAK